MKSTGEKPEVTFFQNADFDIKTFVMTYIVPCKRSNQRKTQMSRN